MITFIFGNGSWIIDKLFMQVHFVQYLQKKLKDLCVNGSEALLEQEWCVL